MVRAELRVPEAELEVFGVFPAAALEFGVALKAVEVGLKAVYAGLGMI